MDDLDDREAFLRAIFADPDNDLPRLVFADWLDERNESAPAELIRVQCELHALLRADAPAAAEQVIRLTLRQRELLPEVFGDRAGGKFSDCRGFLPADGIFASAELLGDPTEFRRVAGREYPQWYGCTALKVSGGLVVGAKPIHTVLNSPVTERVTELDLSGAVVAFQREAAVGDDSSGLLGEYEYRPVVTVQAVQALVDAREARRITRLDLRNNDLDNDAARSIRDSKNLTRLRSLLLFDGNQLRGRTWQQLLERFGPDVLQ